MSSSFDPPENTPPAFGERANGGSAGGDLAGGDAIIDVSTENFMVEVIEASQSRLVLLEFMGSVVRPVQTINAAIGKTGRAIRWRCALG